MGWIRKHRLAVGGIFALALSGISGIKWLVGLLGDVDFIISRWQDPAWLGVLLWGLLTPAPWWSIFLSLGFGLGLLALDYLSNRVAPVAYAAGESTKPSVAPASAAAAHELAKIQNRADNAKVEVRLDQDGSFVVRSPVNVYDVTIFPVVRFRTPMFADEDLPHDAPIVSEETVKNVSDAFAALRKASDALRKSGKQEQGEVIVHVIFREHVEDPMLYVTVKDRGGKSYYRIEQTTNRYCAIRVRRFACPCSIMIEAVPRAGASV